MVISGTVYSIGDWIAQPAVISSAPLPGNGTVTGSGSNDRTGTVPVQRLFGIEELMEATDGFDESCMIQGYVCKGSIEGEDFAIKKIKWNACNGLKILQKKLAFLASTFRVDDARTEPPDAEPNRL
ncbi:lysM domain receptor kinase 4 [Spatholobus suberectus]|nr:lysM domain receptor kinase 4 [Spatholobus suberectus]